MNILFFATNKKIPFSLDENENIVCRDYCLYHGIISRGMIKSFQDEKLDLILWNQYASFINDDSFEISDPTFKKIQDLAISCKYLSFNQSVICAKKFLEQYSLGKFDTEGIKYEIHSLQEGNVSSVWKIVIKDPDEQLVDTFVLNIARDNDAGKELINSSLQMQQISDLYANVVQVYSIETVTIDYFGSFTDIVVTGNEYISNAYNIYQGPTDEFGKQQYYLADGFADINKNDEDTKYIMAKLADQAVVKEITGILQLFSNTNLDGSLTQFNINEGDLVWNGEKVMIVAVS